MVGKMKRLVCLALAGAALSTQALAAPVSYNFEASFSETFFNRIDSVPDDTLYNEALLLASISGVLSYDPDAELLVVAQVGIASFLTLNSISVEELALNFSDGSVFVEDADAIPDNFIDQDRISFQYSGALVPGEDDLFFAPIVLVDFIDSTNTAVSDFSLPTNLSLSDFTAASIAVGTIVSRLADDGGIPEFVGSAIVRFDIDRLAEVPVPAALPLFLAGAAGLGALLRRKKRPAFEDA